jgi:hypothetical protein
MDEGSRRIAVTPEMPEQKLRSLWSHAVEEVRKVPGLVIIFDFAPGSYAMPYTGPVAYGTSTQLHVKPPGYKITLTYIDARGLSMSPHRYTENERR